MPRVVDCDDAAAPVIVPDTLRRIRRVLQVEATLFVLLLCASLMAHGVGPSWRDP